MWFWTRSKRGTTTEGGPKNERQSLPPQGGRPVVVRRYYEPRDPRQPEPALSVFSEPDFRRDEWETRSTHSTKTEPGPSFGKSVSFLDEPEPLDEKLANRDPIYRRSQPSVNRTVRSERRRNHASPAVSVKSEPAFRHKASRRKIRTKMIENGVHWQDLPPGFNGPPKGSSAKSAHSDTSRVSHAVSTQSLPPSNRRRNVHAAGRSPRIRRSRRPISLRHLEEKTSPSGSTARLSRRRQSNRPPQAVTPDVESSTIWDVLDDRLFSPRLPDRERLQPVEPAQPQRPRGQKRESKHKKRISQELRSIKDEMSAIRNRNEHLARQLEHANTNHNKVVHRFTDEITSLKQLLVHKTDETQPLNLNPRTGVGDRGRRNAARGLEGALFTNDVRSAPPPDPRLLHGRWRRSQPRKPRKPLTLSDQGCLEREISRQLTLVFECPSSLKTVKLDTGRGRDPSVILLEPSIDLSRSGAHHSLADSVSFGTVPPAAGDATPVEDRLQTLQETNFTESIRMRRVENDSQRDPCSDASSTGGVSSANGSEAKDSNVTTPSVIRTKSSVTRALEYIYRKHGSESHEDGSGQPSEFMF